jgi:hypothetical protein
LRSLQPVVATLLANERRLTRGQRAVVRRLVAPPSRARASAATLAELRAIATEAQQRLEQRGLRFTHQVLLNLAPESATGGGAYEHATWVDGGSICDVRVLRDSLGDGTAALRRMITHEIVHCAQDEPLTTPQQVAAVPYWVSEGSALWASDVVVGEWNGAPPTGGLGNWFQRPYLPISTRFYDAAGFWALLAQEGVDVWRLLPRVWEAAGGGDAAAWTAATADAPPSVFEHWGTTLHQRPSLGAPWNLVTPEVGQAFPVDVTEVANGTSTGEFVAGRGALRLALGVTADLLEVGMPDGATGIIRDSSGTERPAASARFCAKPGGCRCPDGTDLGLPQIGPGLVLVGVAQQALNGVVTVGGSSLDQACKKRTPEPQSPQPPQPSGNYPGIMLFQASINGGETVVTTFPSGRCSVGSGSFHATASAGGYTLRVTIANFGGYQTYPLRWFAADPTFTVEGPGGPFDNMTFPGGTPPPAGGEITFADNGAGMGLGFLQAYNAAASDAVLLAGVMGCTR